MRGLVPTIVVAALVASAILFAKDPDPRAARPAPPTADDEAIIRKNVEAFAKAYNAGDANGVAALFANEAQLIDDTGATTQGRSEIQKLFAGIFADAPKSHIDVTIESIRFIGNALAVETGLTRVLREPSADPESNRYTVMHVKTKGGQWLMALARDTEGTEPDHHERLKALEWLVGEWADEGPDSVVLTNCTWSEDKKFLLQDIHVQIAGRPAMRVSQRIGWDPLAKQIRSWVFDSQGGFGEGRWTRDGNGWIVKATGTRSDGSTASATNTIVPLSKDSYTWRSTDRVAGDEIETPVDVTVVRKPPAPTSK